MRRVVATPRSTPQMTVAVPELLRRQAQFIADKREEHDRIGKGVAAVIRKALAGYVRRHIDDWREHPDFPRA